MDQSVDLNRQLYETSGESLEQAQDWRDHYASETEEDEDQTQEPSVVLVEKTANQDISTFSITQVSSFLLKNHIPKEYCTTFEGTVITLPL